MINDQCPGDWTQVEPHRVAPTYQVVDYCYKLIGGECVVAGAIQFQGTILECEAWINLRDKKLLKIE